MAQREGISGHRQQFVVPDVDAAKRQQRRHRPHGHVPVDVEVAVRNVVDDDPVRGVFVSALSPQRVHVRRQLGPAREAVVHRQGELSFVQRHLGGEDLGTGSLGEPTEKAKRVTDLLVARSLVLDRGRVVGRFVYAAGTLNNGLTLMDVSSFWQDVTRGGVLLLAVGLDQMRSRAAGG